MALPTLVKTWQFNVNIASFGSGSVDTDHRNVMLQIKNALKAFGTAPWTVSGSSNGTTAGMDGVDRWNTTADVVPNSSNSSTTNHSWIVLRQTALGPKYEVLFDFNGSTNFGNPTTKYLSIYVSPVNGFGGANGGTNGGITVRPTATDEMQLLGNSIGGTAPAQTSNVAWLGSLGSTFTARIHALQSTDGQCTRVVVCVANVVLLFLAFEKAQNPVAGWTNPTFAIVRGGANSTDQTMTYAYLNHGAQFTQGNTYLRATTASVLSQNAAIARVFLTAEGINNANGALGEVVFAPNDFDQSWPLLPVGLLSDTGGARGRLGTMFDAWFGSSAVPTGETYPADPNARQFAQFGHLILPWKGDATVTLVA